MAEENKYESCFDETPQPSIVCGKCGVKYFSKADIDSDFSFKMFRRSKRRQKIVKKRMPVFYKATEDAF